MSSLFEIVGERLQFEGLLDDQDIELDEQAFLDTWEALEGETNDKVAAWAAWITRLEDDVNSRKEFMDKLAKKNATDTNKINHMRSILKMVMERLNIKKAGNEIISATLCTAGGKLPLLWADGIREDARLLPEKYQKVETIYRADTDLIRKDLDAGIEVPGVEYGERSTYLRIK